MTPDLVFLGNLLVDDVVFPDGSTRMGEPGGSVIHAALGAHLWGSPTGVVSVVGDDYPAWALDALRERGVDLGGVRSLGRTGLRIWLLYEERLRQFLHRLERPTHAQVSPVFEDIPIAWRKARCFHLCPMPLPTQRDLVERLCALPGAFVSLDPFVLLTQDTLEAWRAVVAKVDALFLSEDENLLAPDDLPAVAKRLSGGRLRFIFFKRAARGGVLWDARDERLVTWSAHATTVVDPTGAGDAFAAGVLAGWLRGEPLERALARGAVGASFVVEDWGPRGLLGATPESAELRLGDGREV